MAERYTSWFSVPLIWLNTLKNLKIQSLKFSLYDWCVDSENKTVGLGRNVYQDQMKGTIHPEHCYQLSSHYQTASCILFAFSHSSCQGTAQRLFSWFSAPLIWLNTLENLEIQGRKFSLHDWCVDSENKTVGIRRNVYQDQMKGTE